MPLACKSSCLVFRKTKVFLASCFIGLGSASGDVRIDFEFGLLRHVTGEVAAPGSLWALVAAAPGSPLPGGLAQDSSLGVENIPFARADFGSATIAPGSNVGNAVIMATGQVGENPDEGVASDFIELTNDDYERLQAGGLIGFYWFPGILEETAVLPASGFAIGGIQETAADVDSGGNAGMTVPANGGGAIVIAYYDTESTEGASLLPVDRFTAIHVPPSGYQVWRDVFTTSQLEAGDGDPGADPDGDGLANLLEYATGGNPLLGGPSPLVLNRLGESVVLEFHQVADPELRYRIEATDDLGISPWPDVVFESSGVANVDGLIEITRPIQPGRRFFRLRVEFVDGSEF